MRHERKFPTFHLSDSTLELLILSHPLGFRRLYPDRQVNNIYFDTPDWRTFRENLAGISRRAKYRLRWYGPDTERITKAVFEIKWKENLLGRKDHLQVPEVLSWPQADSLSQWLPLLHHNGLQAALVNSYERSYFVSADGVFRLTVDRRLRCAAFAPYPPSFYDMPEALRVIEVKYEEHLDHRLDEMTQHWPLRLHRFSKYVQGIQRIYGDL